MNILCHVLNKKKKNTYFYNKNKENAIIKLFIIIKKF